MGLTSSIRTTLSGIAVKFADGVVEYRVLTSAPNATPRTYGNWTTITGARCCEFSETQTQDSESGLWFREETCELRIPYQANVSLTIKDQVRQGPSAGPGVNDIIWSVSHQKVSGAGSVSPYHLYRRTPMMQNPRKGGV
jgi:hypothetical protein